MPQSLAYQTARGSHYPAKGGTTTTLGTHFTAASGRGSRAPATQVRQSEREDSLLEIESNLPIWTMTELKGEFLGTFTLVLGGLSTMATAYRRDVDEDIADNSNNVWAKALYVNLGWTFSVVMGFLLSWDSSGAHLNPAVSIGAMLALGFNRVKCVLYIAAQFLGAFAAATFVMVVHTGMGATADVQSGKYSSQIYHTGPSPGVSVAQAFILEMLGTCFLLAALNFVINGENPSPNKLIMFSSVGVIVFWIGMTMGYLAGPSLNPARDMPPRIVWYIHQVVQGQSTEGIFDNTDFIAPNLGPIVGAYLGILVHKFFSAPSNSPGKSSGEVELEAALS